MRALRSLGSLLMQHQIPGATAVTSVLAMRFLMVPFGDGGSEPAWPDNGVSEFVNLFSDAVLGRPFDCLSKAEQWDFVDKFQYNVSDHMPLWMRLPLP